VRAVTVVLAEQVHAVNVEPALNTILPTTIKQILFYKI